MRRDAFDDDARDDVPETAGVHLKVGRLEHDHEAGLVHQPALEEHGQRALGDRDLLAREEQEAQVDPGLGRRGPAGELDHDGDAALHVARAEPVHDAVLEPPGKVALGRDGVEMSGQHDERTAAAHAVEERLALLVDGLERDDLPHVGGGFLLVRALGRDVDELERPAGEVGDHFGAY